MGSISIQGDPLILQYSMDSRGTLNSGEPVSLTYQPGIVWESRNDGWIMMQADR